MIRRKRVRLSVRTKWLWCVATLLVASGASAGGLPWDRGLGAIGATLTGVVAGGVAVIAIAAVGIARAINADIPGAVEKVVGVVIIMSIVGSSAMLVGNLGLAGGLLP